jgi:hypothetical protein
VRWGRSLSHGWWGWWRRSSDRRGWGSSRCNNGNGNRSRHGRSWWRDRSRRSCNGSGNRGFNDGCFNDRRFNDRRWHWGRLSNRSLCNGCGSRRRYSRSRSITDADEGSSNLDGVIFGNKNRLDDSGDGGGNLGVDLVGGDFD